MPPATPLQVGQQLHGFTVNRVTPLPGLRVTAVECEHAASGAALIHLHAPADTENCFAVTFPTPPPDDTGVPHIMEHSVLGGSRQFPVREPFFEMVKMSMATFINAMTYQTFTVYPVATNVKKDFCNLATVYLDAVFHPLLAENTFRREGHHLALENNADPASPLKISGIVYNEMKGAYSAPESLMWELAGRGLFPDTPLGRDSGGDPDRIPDLTYAQFKKFHQTLYHPSNALIFVYGDIPTRDHLRFLAPVLRHFKRRPRVAFVSPATLPRQPRWSAPRRLEREYPVGASEDTASRAFLTLNWIVGDALDPARVTEWELLDRILLGNEAAPLKKALVDSHFGADVFFAGTFAGAYEQEFHVGLKGSEPDRADAFERLVLDTLERLAAELFPPDRVAAAFQQLAYDHLEVKSLFPMRLLYAVNSAWPFGADPLSFLRLSEQLEACQARYAHSPDLFNRLLRDGLLANPHRLRVLLRPDRQAQARADAAFAARMSEQRRQFNPDQLAAIGRNAAALEAAQGQPNSPEALAKLPQLKVGDLPAKPRHIPTEFGRSGGFELLHNDVFANGVNYFEFDADLAGLPPELYHSLPRFADALNKMGAAGQSFATIAERRSACTGGLGCQIYGRRHATDPTRTLRRVRFGLKTLDREAGNALRLLGDLIFGIDPRDRDRLRDVLTQARAGYRSSLINDGLGTARRQAARGLSPEGALAHQFLSPDALRLLEKLTAQFDQNAETVSRQVEQIRDFLLNSRRWTVSFTGSASVFELLNQTLADWTARMRDEPVVDALPPFQPFAQPPREGLAGPMKIAHCAKVMPAPHLAHPDVPLFWLGVYLARFDYFLPEIRFKGNAYGAGAVHDDGHATFALYSFRDPRILETLLVFDGLRDWLAAQHWSQTDIDRAIIGSAKEVEKPIRPGEATSLALLRHLCGDTNDQREQRYAATLRATPATVKETTLRLLETNEPRSAICVVSSRENLEQANRSLGPKSLAIANILD